MLFDSMLVDGGASSNNWLMQLQADVSTIKIKRPKSLEATAFGAAKCAATFSNFWNDESIQIDHVFLPSSDKTDLISQWHSALKLIT